MSEFEIPKGTAVGVCDSNGAPICIGDTLRRDIHDNDMHGDWVEYTVELRGLTPVLFYLRSQKGQVLPVGYTGGILANDYDNKMFLWSDALCMLEPSDTNLVVVPSS